MSVYTGLLRGVFWENCGVGGKPAPCLKCSRDASLNSINVTESINTVT